MANKKIQRIIRYVCKHCGHSEGDHYLGWGDCEHDDCVCCMYEPSPVDLFDLQFDAKWQDKADALS